MARTLLFHDLSFSQKRRAKTIRRLIIKSDVKELLPLLVHQEVWVRDVVASSLGAIARWGDGAEAVVNAGGVQALVFSLNDETSRVRCASAFSLSFIASDGEAKSIVESGGIKALVQRFKEDDDEVREWVIGALQHVAKGGEVEAIIETGSLSLFLTNLGEDGCRWRGKTAETLDEIAKNGGANEIVSAGGIQALIKALQDGDKTLSWKALDALNSVYHNGDEKGKVVSAVIGLLAAEDEDVRWRAVKLLGKIKDPSTIKPLEKMVEHDTYEMAVAEAERVLRQLKNNLEI